MKIPWEVYKNWPLRMLIEIGEVFVKRNAPQKKQKSNSKMGEKISGHHAQKVLDNL